MQGKGPGMIGFTGHSSSRAYLGICLIIIAIFSITIYFTIIAQNAGSYTSLGYTKFPDQDLAISQTNSDRVDSSSVSKEASTKQSDLAAPEFRRSTARYVYVRDDIGNLTSGRDVSQPVIFPIPKLVYTRVIQNGNKSDPITMNGARKLNSLLIDTENGFLWKKSIDDTSDDEVSLWNRFNRKDSQSFINDRSNAHYISTRRSMIELLDQDVTSLGTSHPTLNEFKLLLDPDVIFNVKFDNKSEAERTVSSESRYCNMTASNIMSSAIKRFTRRNINYNSYICGQTIVNDIHDLSHQCSHIWILSRINIYIGKQATTRFIQSKGIHSINDILNVTDNQDHYFNTDEYIIDISNGSADVNLYGNSYLGIIRALASLRQLLSPVEISLRSLPAAVAKSLASAYNISIDIHSTVSDQSYNVVGFRLRTSLSLSLPIIIHDWAHHQWRGILIDIARHFQPITLLKRSIDAMEASKLNYLHLHLTDSQAFPVLLDDVDDYRLSSLAFKGSFTSNDVHIPRYNQKIYTKKDLMELVAYAMERGIEIIPEIDVPAHSLSWGRGYADIIRHITHNHSIMDDDIIVRCDSEANTKETPHNIYTLDPTKSQSMNIAKLVIKQITQIFPSKYLHIGGDEVCVSLVWNNL